MYLHVTFDLRDGISGARKAKKEGAQGGSGACSGFGLRAYVHTLHEGSMYPIIIIGYLVFWNPKP